MEEFTVAYDRRTLSHLSKQKLSALLSQLSLDELCTSLAAKYEEAIAIQDLIYFKKTLTRISNTRPEILNEGSFAKLAGKFVYDQLSRPVAAFSKDSAIKRLNDSLLGTSPGNLISLPADDIDNNQKDRPADVI